MTLNGEMRRLLFASLFLAVVIPTTAQTPEIFDVSNVVLGAKRIATQFLYAVGKWSDAGDHAGPMSTQIQCYKSLGFCDVVDALEVDGEANASLDTFDILRWDSNEIIAVDSSPICVVNTLRVDLVKKRITLSSADKGVTKDPLCKGSRLREHLLSLKARFPETELGKAEIQSSDQTDYRYRIVLPKATWVAALAELATEQTWSNFKNETIRFSRAMKAASAYVDALHRIWDVMHRLQVQETRKG